ncbi:MAG: hypothetical protein ACJAU1_001125 [Psychromonas sp.]|jgi:hypothetical protein
MTPAEIVEPMTPAAYGTIACINREFWFSAPSPTLFDNLAAMGTVETPADPIHGLIFNWLD